MKKVFQEYAGDPNKADCMRATVASLFNLELHAVPNFIEFKDNWDSEFNSFFTNRGYEPMYINIGDSVSTQKLKECAEFDGGINGYFFGVVDSQTYPGETHAVVVDKGLNIVHDPNPNQRALKLHPEDVLGIYVMSPIVITLQGNIISYEEYKKCSEYRE
jgi:hypothetical protein